MTDDQQPNRAARRRIARAAKAQRRAREWQPVKGAVYGRGKVPTVPPPPAHATARAVHPAAKIIDTDAARLRRLAVLQEQRRAVEVEIRARRHGLWLP